MCQTSRNLVLSLPQVHNLISVLHQGHSHFMVQFQASRCNSSHITLPHSEYPRLSSAKSCGRSESICTFAPSPQTRPTGKQRSDLHSDPRHRGHYHHCMVLAQFSAELQPKYQANQHVQWSQCTNTDLTLPCRFPASMQLGAPNTAFLCLNSTSMLTEPLTGEGSNQ